MSLSVNPDLERRLRTRAEAEGLTVDALLEGMLAAEDDAIAELVTLADEGIESGDPAEMQAHDWEDLHRRVDERLKFDRQ